MSVTMQVEVSRDSSDSSGRHTGENAVAASSLRELESNPTNDPTVSAESTNPRTSKPPHHHPHPRLKMTLPPPPKPSEVFNSGVPLSDGPVVGSDEGQWFWYEGKRIYVQGANQNRRRIPSSEDGSGGNSSPPEDATLELSSNEDPSDAVIGDDMYDCGFALDLGAEESSPGSLSGSPIPGWTNSYLTSSSSASTSNTSAPSSLPPPSPPLAQSISRRASINTGTGGGSYVRESEKEAGERLLREWAVAVAGKGEVVTPPVPGRRSRGTSISGGLSVYPQLPPVSGERTKSRRGSVTTAKVDVVDKDCGICFEYAVKPSRTVCCGKVFCQEHLNDWLTGPNASGLCPNCDAPCSLESSTISLISPSLNPSKTTSNARRSSTSRSTPLGATPRRVVSSTTPRSEVSTLPSSSSPPSPVYIVQQPSGISATSARASSIQLSPSLLNMHQQYERLLAQEHRPSSPLSTSVPIVNPFDQIVQNKEPIDILGGSEALAVNRGGSSSFGGRSRGPTVRVPIEWVRQEKLQRLQNRSVAEHGDGEGSIELLEEIGVETAVMPAFGGKPVDIEHYRAQASPVTNSAFSQSRTQFWKEDIRGFGGVGQPKSETVYISGKEWSGTVTKGGGSKLRAHQDADYAGALKRLVSLVLCLAFVYLVVAR